VSCEVLVLFHNESYGAH